MKLTRRHTLTLAAVATASSLAGLPSFALAAEGDMLDINKLMAPAGIPDKVLGDPAAKVTVIEYASPTCPHCADWSNNVLQPFKEKYVTTGQVKFIIRPFARNTLDAAIFMLAEHAARTTDSGAAPVPADPSAPSSEMSSEASAEAAPADPSNPSGLSQAAIEAYDNVLAAFFRTQGEWGTSNDPLTALKSVATQLGFTEAAFNEALTNQELFNGIDAMRNQALDEFGLEGTPTFYVNGKQLTGDKTLE
nr:thioredoxin domain-containing protein [Devosia sp.]